MNTSYLNSVQNTISSSKPSRTIGLFLMVLFVSLFGNTVFAQTTGDYRSTGNVTFASATNWQIYNGSAWVNATLAPTSVPSTNTITVSASNTATVSGSVNLNASLAVSGTINLNDNSVFTLGTNSNWANITINSGGKLNMPGGSGLAVLAVYGNYVNNGSTDFWKSTVVIAGDLLSPQSSSLQKQGNVVVGGNINGVFDTTGGNGSGQIYAVDPNATVNITPSQIDGNVIPGVFPASENQDIIDLVNIVIYGGACSFTVNNIANVNACSGSNVVFTCSTNATSASYLWQVNTGSGWVDLAGQTAATLNLTNVTVGMNGYKYRVKVTSSSCTKNGNYGFLYVNTAPAVAAIAGGSTAVCVNSTTPAFTDTTVGGVWSISNGTGTASITSGGVVKGLTAGIVTVVYTYNNGTCSNTAIKSLTVNPPSTPTFTVFPGASSCVNISVTYTTQSGNSNYVWSVPGISGTDYIITSGGIGTSSNTVTLKWLTAGSKTVTVNYNNSSGCAGGAAATNTTTLSIKTWNGSWSPSAPSVTGSDAAIFASGTYSSTGDLAICSCQVKGATVTFISGNTLTVTNAVTVSSGSLTFEDTASLVQINNVTNSGNITYKRQAAVRNTDYTYWSTPVSPLKLAGAGGISYGPSSLAGSIFYSYLVTSTTEDWKSETASTLMEAGKGYSIRASGVVTMNPPSLLGVSFTGVPNNGDYPIALAKSGASYLLGNPYPSAIDADAFLSVNSGVLDGTLYFWTHNTVIQDRNFIANPGSGAYAYTTDDYASYNLTGGVGNDAYGNPKGINAAPSGGIKPNGKIGAGQGFFVTSTTATGNIVFTNRMRMISDAPIDNTQFFRTKNPSGKTKTTNAIEKNRIWLNLTNTEGAFKQTLIGYVTGATNGIDGAYDGESFDGQEFIDFYSINQDKNLTIQGRALPFDENDEVPLGFRSTIEGPFTINIDEVDGSMTNQDVFIEDKLTNTTTNLKTGNYTFNTVAGTFDDRFVLKYKASDKTLGNTDFDAKTNPVVVSIKNKQIKINAFAETIDKVVLFDMTGKEIYQKEKVNSNELLVSNLGASLQTLLVKTVLQNGETVSTKIIY